MTGTHQEQLIDNLKVLLFFIELNLFLYVVITTHIRQLNPAPAQPASPSPPPPRRRRKPQNPWVLPWILQREERGCYRTLLDELITSDIPGYRNFTRMEPAQLNPAPAQPASPSPPPPRRRRKPQNPWVLPWILQREERGCYRTLLDELITSDIPGYRNFTRMEPAFFNLIEERITPPQEVNHQLQAATGSRLETSSYFETLIHRGKLHLTAIPLEGWKIDHLQVYPPGLQSHFERTSTRVSGVPH